MLKKWMRWMVVVVLLVMPTVTVAAGPYFTVTNDRLYFPDGSFLTTAPKDGNTILNGSGAPSVGLVGAIGDFYLDTLNSRLYGPYNGSWGAGVSLVGSQGPQGLKGDTGAAGPAGTSPFTLNGSDAVYTAGSVGIGANPPATAAALEVASTSKGFLPPRMTTVQRDAITAPPAGLTIYNTTTQRPNFYNGSAWTAMAIVQQDVLGQTSGTQSFTTSQFYSTPYVAARTGTISSVSIRVNSTGTFTLLIKDAARVTQRSGSAVVVSQTGLVTIPISPPVTILAGEYLGFSYNGTTTFTSGTGTTYTGASDPPSTLNSNTQVSFSATVSSIN